MGLIRRLSLALLLVPTAAPAATLTLPRGETIERVVCAGDASKSYALYLPSRYEAGSPRPILYLFDPAARGKLAVEMFREAAERYQYILAASNDSRNGQPSGPAMEAVWRDTHERLSLDGRRVSAGGFSGGGRVSILLAQALPGAVDAVIAMSGGFPDGRFPGKDPGFAVFAVAGDRDFNYHEMRRLDAALEKVRAAHRIEIFGGPHAYPPAAVCLESVEWLETRAMARGLMKDAPLAEAIFRKRLARLDERAGSGAWLEAWEGYASLARDFSPILDAGAATERLASLGRAHDIAKLRAQRQSRDEADRAQQESLSRALAAIAASPDPPPLPRCLGQLQVLELRKRAAQTKDPDDAIAAQRRLEDLFSQTTQFLPQALLERGETSRALFILSIAGEIDPASPRPWYARARIHARAGSRGKALADLQTAVARGLRDRRLIEGEPDFAPLTGDEGFAALLRSFDEAKN